jgi:hypothetical protein
MCFRNMSNKNTLVRVCLSDFAGSVLHHFLEHIQRSIIILDIIKPGVDKERSVSTKKKYYRIMLRIGRSAAKVAKGKSSETKTAHKITHLGVRAPSSIKRISWGNDLKYSNGSFNQTRSTSWNSTSKPETRARYTDVVLNHIIRENVWSRYP